MRASLYIYIYIFFFLVPPVLCRQSWKFNHRVRVREYEECITGTGASKAAFPGYDARCVRREQWEMNLSLVSRMEILNCGNAACFCENIFYKHIFYKQWQLIGFARYY